MLYCHACNVEGEKTENTHVFSKKAALMGRVLLPYTQTHSRETALSALSTLSPSPSLGVSPRAPRFSIYVYIYIWGRNTRPHMVTRAQGGGGHRNATCVVPYVCRDTNEARSAACAARVREYAPMHVLRLALSGGRGRGQDGARGKMQQLSVSEPRSTRGRHTAGWRWLRQG